MCNIDPIPLDTRPTNVWTCSFLAVAFWLVGMAISFAAGTVVGVNFDARLYPKITDEVGYWRGVFWAYFVLGTFGIVVLEALVLAIPALRTPKKMILLVASLVVVLWLAYTIVIILLANYCPTCWLVPKCMTGSDWVKKALWAESGVSLSVVVALSIVISCEKLAGIISRSRLSDRGK